MMQYNKDLESQFFTPRESPERPPHFERHKKVITYSDKWRKNTLQFATQCATPNQKERVKFKKAGSDMFQQVKRRAFEKMTNRDPFSEFRKS